MSIKPYGKSKTSMDNNKGINRSQSEIKLAS